MITTTNLKPKHNKGHTHYTLPIQGLPLEVPLITTNLNVTAKATILRENKRPLQGPQMTKRPDNGPSEVWRDATKIPITKAIKTEMIQFNLVVQQWLARQTAPVPMNHTNSLDDKQQIHISTSSVWACELLKESVFQLFWCAESKYQIIFAFGWVEDHQT